jgi:hypothetical protein
MISDIRHKWRRFVEHDSLIHGIPVSSAASVIPVAPNWSMRHP